MRVDIFLVLIKKILKCTLPTFHSFFNVGFWLHFCFYKYICRRTPHTHTQIFKLLRCLVSDFWPSRSTKTFQLYFYWLLTLMMASNWLLISSQFSKDKDFSSLLHLCIIFMNTKSSWRFLSSSIYLWKNRDRKKM